MDPIRFLMLPGAENKGGLETAADALLSNIQTQWQQNVSNSQQNVEEALKTPECCTLSPPVESACDLPISLFCLALGIPLKQLALTLDSEAESYNKISFLIQKKKLCKKELEPLLIQGREYANKLINIEAEYPITPNSTVNRFNRACMVDTIDREEALRKELDEVRKKIETLRERIYEYKRDIAKEKKIYMDLKTNSSRT